MNIQRVRKKLTQNDFYNISHVYFLFCGDYCAEYFIFKNKLNLLMMTAVIWCCVFSLS